MCRNLYADEKVEFIFKRRRTRIWCGFFCMFFSVTFGTLYSFFTYIWLVYVTVGTLYSVFHIHLARLRYLRHIVFGFSHTFGSFTLPSAHCIRFFAYIWLIYVTFGTLYSVIRIHLARYVTVGTLYSVFRIHLARLCYRRHIVFSFSHTFVRKLD